MGQMVFGSCDTLGKSRSWVNDSKLDTSPMPAGSAVGSFVTNMKRRERFSRTETWASWYVSKVLFFANLSVQAGCRLGPIVQHSHSSPNIWIHLAVVTLQSFMMPESLSQSTNFGCSLLKGIKSFKYGDTLYSC